MIFYSAVTVLVLSVASLFWIVAKIREVEDELDGYPETASIFGIADAAVEEDAGSKVLLSKLSFRVAGLEDKLGEFSNVFAQWQKNKDKLIEKIVLSGLKQEIEQQTGYINIISNTLEDLKKNSLQVNEGYNQLKNSISETLSKQISLLPQELQPIISQFQQDSQTLILHKENFLQKLRAKDELISSAVSRLQKINASKEQELLAKKDDFRELRSKMRENLSALNAKLEEIARTSEETIKYTQSEIESLKTRKESMLQTAGQTRENAREHITRIRQEINREVELIKSELRNTEAANTELLNKKEEDIMALNARILEVETGMQSKRTVFERIVERFKNRISYKQQQALEQKQALELEQNRLIKEKKEEYEKLKNEVLSAENTLKKELEKEITVYREEEAGLLKARQDYIQRLESAKQDYSNKSTEYESEISKLMQKISDTEKRWEEEMSLKKNNFEQEKNMLFQKLRSIREHIEQEQLGRQELVEAMRNEFKLINESSAETIQKLKTEFKESTEKFNSGKEALLAQISEASKLLEIERANMDEASSSKLAELNSLRRRYSELAEKVEAEKNEMSLKVENQKKKLQEELEDVEKLFKDELSLTASEKKTLDYQLDTLKMENSNREKEHKLAVEKKRKEHEKADSELNFEISRIQSEMAKKKELFAKTIKEADSEIKKLLRDIAVKDSELKEYQTKTDMTVRKSTDSLIRSIERVKKKVESYKANIAAELKSKNEEIQTLKVRLSLREEMLENELAKKEEAMSNISQRLKIYTDQLQEDSRKQSNQSENTLRPLIAKIEHLKKQNQDLSGKIENQRARHRVFVSKVERMEKEVKALENEPAGDFMQLDRLLKLKEKEIVLLNSEIISKESVLMDSGNILDSGNHPKPDVPAAGVKKE